MNRKLLRGRVLTFLREPKVADDTGAYRYHEDGAVLIDGRLIEAVGDHGSVGALAGDAQRIDHRPHLICPGFIDAHIHFPQVQVIASWGAQLIDWLNTYTFPAELAFADPAHAAAMAGTRPRHPPRPRHCSGLLLGHPGSAEALFAQAERRDMRIIAGKVLMDRNAPEALRDTPLSGYDDTRALIARWHGRGRALYAITPRFAITSSIEQLAAAGALARDHPDCYVQTHQSESHARSG